MPGHHIEQPQDRGALQFPELSGDRRRGDQREPGRMTRGHRLQKLLVETLAVLSDLGEIEPRLEIQKIGAGVAVQIEIDQRDRIGVGPRAEDLHRGFDGERCIPDAARRRNERGHFRIIARRIERAGEQASASAQDIGAGDRHAQEIAHADLEEPALDRVRTGLHENDDGLSDALHHQRLQCEQVITTRGVDLHGHDRRARQRRGGQRRLEAAGMVQQREVRVASHGFAERAGKRAVGADEQYRGPGRHGSISSRERAGRRQSRRPCQSCSGPSIPPRARRWSRNPCCGSPLARDR